MLSFVKSVDLQMSTIDNYKVLLSYTKMLDYIWIYAFGNGHFHMFLQLDQYN